MKKIVFGITSMNIGGAEKVLVDLISSLKSDYDITLFTIYKKGILLNSLDKNIKVVGLVDKKYEDLSFVMKKILGISFFFKPIMYLIYSKYIKNKFDTEVAFLEGPITNLFSFKSKANKIAWVHTDISKHFKSINRYKNYYDKYNKIVFVSKDSLEGFNSVIVNNVEKLVIHNYIDKNRVKNLSRSFVVKEIDNKTVSFLSVCRLVTAKALDRLTLVSKKLIEEGFDHKIYIIGDGQEKENLNKLINSLELQDKFILLGEKENPYPYMKKADYFLIPSLYEGYSMVAVEAIILEKRIISTDTGAKEALKTYDNKLIVDNSLDGLYEGMKKEIETHKNKKITLKNYKVQDETLDKIKEIL